MPPKKKPKVGGKKKKGKGKKKPVQPLVPEIDKAFYELQITDLNRKLARLRESHEVMESKLLATQTELKNVDDDRADVIAYLDRSLIARIDEIESLRETIHEMEESREAEIQIYKEQVLESQREYRAMQMELTSENKLLIGKLNALDEFRAQRNDLMAKFEDQEKRMEDQEARHKKALYDAERKFIVGKDVLKKEMENRIIHLATEFQKNTDMRIAATTQRVIRDNIALNNEFDLIFETLQRCENENDEFKKNDKKLTITLDILEEQNRTVVGRTNLHKKIIHQLSNEHNRMSQKISSFAPTEKRLTYLKESVQIKDQKLKQVEHQNRKMLQAIHLYKCQVKNLETELGNQQLDYERILDIVYNAVNTIDECRHNKSSQTPKECLKVIKKLLECVDEESPKRIMSLATVESTNLERLPNKDDSYVLLPKVKAYKYMRNVKDEATSVHSSLPGTSHHGHGRMRVGSVSTAYSSKKHSLVAFSDDIESTYVDMDDYGEIHDMGEEVSGEFMDEALSSEMDVESDVQDIVDMN